MTFTPLQEEALAHLRSAYVGPEGGPTETSLNQPHRQYVVGILFPIELGRGEPTSANAAGEDDLAASADVEEGDVEEGGTDVPLAEDWRPSSVAVSFVVDSPIVDVDLGCGTYEQVRGDGPPRWTRTPHELSGLTLSRNAPPLQETVGRVPIQIGARWREYGDAWLVTVHVRVTAQSTGDAREDIPLMLFQVAVATYGGFFGAGIGILMLAALGMMGVRDIHRANGLKNLAAVCINGVAAVTFVVGGRVAWAEAAVMAAGAMLGGALGAGTARKVGPRVVRRAVMTVGVALAAAMFWRRLRG